MAIKRAQYLPRNEVDDEYEVDDIGLEQNRSEEEQELFTLIDDFNTADPKSQIRVYEAKEPGVNTRGQLPLAYLFTFTPGQLTSQMLMDRVNEEYGPGNYEAHIYAPHPAHDNRIKLARKIKFEIGQTRDEKEDSLPFARRRHKQKSGGESPSEIMRTFAEMMAAQNERTEALMREILQRNQGGITDPMSAMAQMMGIMVQFQQMMPQPPPPPSLIDEVQKLAVLKEIFSDMGGGGGETSESGIWLKMLDKFGTPLVNALGQPQQPTQPIPGAPMMQLPSPQPHPGYFQNPQARNPNQAMQMPPPQNPQISAPSNSAPKSQPSAPQSQKETDEMRENVNRLVSMAKMGLAPEMVASKILDLTPEENEEKLYDFISDERCIEKMAAVNPEVNSHRAFFDELRAAIMGAFEEVSHDADGEHLHGDNDGATLAETGNDVAQETAAGETGKQA